MATNINNSKSKVSINFVDIIVILLIILGVVLFSYEMKEQNDPIALSQGKEVIIEYTVQIDKLPIEIEPSIEAGNKAIDPETGKSFGEVASPPAIKKYLEYLYNEDIQGIEVVESNAYNTLEITIKAKAQQNEYGYYVEGKRIAIEANIKLSLPALEAEGKCISINPINNEEAK